MSTLFNLTHQQKDLISKIESGDIDEKIAVDTLESLDGSISDKYNRCCQVLRKFEGDLDNIKSEISRLKSLETQKKNEIIRIKNLIKTGLSVSGERSIDTGLFKIHTRKGLESIVVSNLEMIPDEFIEPTITYKANKGEIKKAIKEGREVPGCSISVGDESLIVK